MSGINWWDQTLEERVDDYKNELNKPLRSCNDCGAEPNSLHQPGCDVARCALCGGQAISCECSEGDYNEETDEYDHIELDWETTTVPWQGYWPGIDKCVEFGVDLNMLGREPIFGWDRDKLEWYVKDQKALEYFRA